MGKVFEGIDDKLAAWIGRQRMFFVGSAPSDVDGHVNVSPKAPIESLRVFAPRQVGYLDLVGSGAETVAHVRDNGRIVIMLCAFEGAPRVVRLHGRAEAVQIGERRFEELEARFDLEHIPAAAEAMRAVIVVELDRISDSCGYDVPLMRFEGVRPQRRSWMDGKLRKNPNAMIDYIAEENERSVDGLPSLELELLPGRVASPR
jgi:pyridoxamine 5'-phosphate oxidase-like protein